MRKGLLLRKEAAQRGVALCKGFVFKREAGEEREREGGEERVGLLERGMGEGARVRCSCFFLKKKLASFLCQALINS